LYGHDKSDRAFSDTKRVFTRPEDNKLSDDLDIFFKDCDLGCKISVTSRKNYDVSDFLDDNPKFKSTFNYQNQLIEGINIQNLKSDLYTFTLNCKDSNGSKDSKNVMLSVFPMFRWREIIPELKNGN